MAKVNVEVVECYVAKNSLKQAMEKRGLSQEATARLTGVMTSRQLTRIINGEHCPSLLRATALSVVLKTRVDHLFTIRTRTRVQG